MKHIWNIDSHFPSLPSSHCFLTQRPQAANWKQAVRIALREFGKMPELKGKKIAVVKLTISRVG